MYLSTGAKRYQASFVAEGRKYYVGTGRNYEELLQKLRAKIQQVRSGGVFVNARSNGIQAKQLFNSKSCARTQKHPSETAH